MFEGQNDLTVGDFNPEMLFVSKMKMEKNDIYHCHQDFTELTIILSGKTDYYVEGETVEAESGDIIVCNPGVRHHNVVKSRKYFTTEFFVGFQNYHFKNMPENRIELKEGGYLLRLPPDQKEEVKKLCYEMLAENANESFGKYFMLKAKLMQLLILMVRGIEEPPKTHIRGYNFENYNRKYAVKKIITYINENYPHKISLDRIAHNMYLSPVYVSKIFKEETGESPISYLIKVRLEKAKAMLENNENDSIKGIAMEVGYDDVYHFSKLFKKYYGQSPQNYRREYISKIS